jgi:hypothetical protein
MAGATMKLTDRELATVLAALRNWQQHAPVLLRHRTSHTRYSDFFLEHRPLDLQEIDALCEKINLGEPEG